MNSDANSPATPSAAFWEPHYQQYARPWSGEPNLILSTVAKTLSAGRSLDLGCSNGGDTIWLAQQGWIAMGVDVSPTVVETARQGAARAGVTGQASFAVHDLSQTMPSGPFDLVSASFFHTPVSVPRDDVFRRAAMTLAPGGVLLIVDHASVAPWSWDQSLGQSFPTPEETYHTIALDPKVWRLEILERRDRLAKGPEDATATVTDNVILVRRATHNIT